MSAPACRSLLQIPYLLLVIPELEDICQNVKMILEGKSLCQQDPDADEDEEPLEDQAEFDSVLISSTSDVVATLASVLGPDFAQVFGTFLPLIAKNMVGCLSVRARSAIGLTSCYVGQEQV